MLALSDSPHLVHAPPVDPDRCLHVDRTSFPTWKAMFSAHPTVLDFLIAAGDYRGHGPLEPPGSAGSATRPRTVRFHAAGPLESDHPVRRSTAARVDSIRFTGSTTKNWFVQGLTISDPGTDCAIQGGASRVTVDGCLIERAGRYGVRIRDAQGCTIQRCVIRDSILFFTASGTVADAVGVQVKPRDAHVLDIKLLDNEIYNVGDGIQLTAAPDPELAVEALIEGNDIYLEPSRYLDPGDTTWDENAIDLKVGSDTVESTVLRRNRLWGYRRNAKRTAQGELLVIQKTSRNVLVEENTFGDAPRGMKDENWKAAPFERRREVVFRNNQFHDIRDHAGDHGAVTRPITAGLTFDGNHFARSDYLADQTPPAYRGAPLFTDNVLVEVGAVQRPESQKPPLQLDASHNPSVTAPRGFDTYERKRWTGPELATGAIPLP